MQSSKKCNLPFPRATMSQGEKKKGRGRERECGRDSLSLAWSKNSSCINSLPSNKDRKPVRSFFPGVGDQRRNRRSSLASSPFSSSKGLIPQSTNSPQHLLPIVRTYSTLQWRQPVCMMWSNIPSCCFIKHPGNKSSEAQSTWQSCEPERCRKQEFSCTENAKVSQFVFIPPGSKSVGWRSKPCLSEMSMSILHMGMTWSMWDGIFNTGPKEHFP